MFSIEFLASESRNYYEAEGKVVFGRSIEYFRSALGFWKRRDYERQWIAAIQQLISGVEACLITETVGTGQAGHLLFYVGYPSGDCTVFQEMLIQAKDLPLHFDPMHPEGVAGPRVTVNAEGGDVLEWCVRRADLITFLGEKLLP